MEFEWDADKNGACLDGRGFDFSYVLHAFFDTDRLIRKDMRWNYGGDRYQLLGRIDDRVFFCGVHHARNGHPHYFGAQG